jgi:hypothetical protein
VAVTPAEADRTAAHWGDPERQDVIVDRLMAAGDSTRRGGAPDGGTVRTASSRRRAAASPRVSSDGDVLAGEAEVTVWNAVVVKPVDGLLNGLSVAMRDEESVRDDADLCVGVG